MNRPAMILGSGPSLDEAAPLLKDWKNPIFSSTSTAFVPVRWERKPDYMCAFDSLWSLYNKHLYLDKKYSWEGTTLFTHPNAEPLMIKAWKWNKYYYRRVFAGHEFFELTFPMMFPWIKVGLTFSGCVVNNAVSLAIFLGFNPIVLVGVDFGWRDDAKTKATNWYPEKGEWSQEANAPLDKNRQLIELESGVHTHPEYFTFKNFLVDIYRQHNIEFIDCSDGILEEFKKEDVKEVIKTQGWGDYKIDRDSTISNIKKYFEDFNGGKYAQKEEDSNL